MRESPADRHRRLNRERMRRKRQDPEFRAQEKADRESPEGRERGARRSKRYHATAHYRAKKKALREANMARARALHGDACQDCGAADRLHFHHLDPATKAFEIGCRADYAWATIEAELAKCVLVCEPCHKERHRNLSENSLARS